MSIIYIYMHCFSLQVDGKKLWLNRLNQKEHAARDLTDPTGRPRSQERRMSLVSLPQRKKQDHPGGQPTVQTNFLPLRSLGLVETSASLLVTSALLVVTRSY